MSSSTARLEKDVKEMRAEIATLAATIQALNNGLTIATTATATTTKKPAKAKKPEAPLEEQVALDYYKKLHEKDHLERFPFAANGRRGIKGNTEIKNEYLAYVEEHPEFVEKAMEKHGEAFAANKNAGKKNGAKAQVVVGSEDESESATTKTAKKVPAKAAGKPAAKKAVNKKTESVDDNTASESDTKANKKPAAKKAVAKKEASSDDDSD